jgi:hypothetical protein
VYDDFCHGAFASVSTCYNQDRLTTKSTNITTKERLPIMRKALSHRLVSIFLSLFMASFVATSVTACCGGGDDSKKEKKDKKKKKKKDKEDSKTDTKKE